MNNSLKKILLLAGFFVLLMAIPFLDFHSEDEFSTISFAGTGNSSTFPIEDFELTSISGQSSHISDYFGTPMVLNFFATWCGPCEAEMPLLDDFSVRLKDEALFFGINTGEDKEIVSEFIDKEEISFEIFLDPNNKISRQFLVRGLPTTIFIDKNGVMVAKHIGLLTPELLDGYLNKLGLNQ